MASNSEKNRRIAKNTLFLYLRSIVILGVSLYTSRVVLAALGVENYGIYNVVGGVVAMFSCVSGALSGAISRFITFELGRGNVRRLNTVFSTSVMIQAALAAVLVSLILSAGGWFLNAEMNIPAARLDAANWVLACAAASFGVGLISVAYNAVIIAHEHMKAFAYVSVLDAGLKLGAVFLLERLPFDELKTYAVLLLCVSLCIQMTYAVYCRTHFPESRLRLVWDGRLLREMFGFAGWAFFSNSVGMLNAQGINILMNMFFGVAINAARGIATQVESALLQFVGNFTTSVNPQITKSYAAGDTGYMFSLICRGSKFAFFLALIFVVPIFVEADTVLALWLGNVPEHAADFLRLTLLTMLPQVLGGVLFTAAMATGRIRAYALWVNGVSILTFVIALAAFVLGAPPLTAYFAHLLVRIVLVSVRVWLLKRMIVFPPEIYLRKVAARILPISALAFAFSLAVSLIPFPHVFLRVAATGTASVCGALFLVVRFGLDADERRFVMEKIRALKTKFSENKNN